MEEKVYNISMHINQSKFSMISGLSLSGFLICMLVLSQGHVLERSHETITMVLAFGGIGVSILLSVFPLPHLHGKKQKAAQLFFSLLVPAGAICSIELLNTNLLSDIELPVNALMNILTALLFMMILYAISGSVRLSSRILMTAGTVFGIVNMYVKMYKGSPLIPWDLTVLRTAGRVAGRFSYQWNVEMAAAVSWTIAVWKAADCIGRENRKSRFCRTARIISACIPAVTASVFYGTDVFAEKFGASPDFFNQTRGYENMGALAEFVVNTRYMHLNAPEDYDASTAADNVGAVSEQNHRTITEAITGDKPQEDVEKPDIIVIMNESFSDLSTAGSFETNEDPIPFINSLKNDPNTIEGNSYVSTIGTGTSNTEYEFLTGNSMAFLPAGSNAYQLYVEDGQPSLVSTLRDQGYGAQAFHPYYKDDWNRPAVYRGMGFDDFTAMEDISGCQILRNYVSDAWDFSWVENAWQNRDPSKPFFLFNVTMQNHSPYDRQYDNFDQQIRLENMQGNYPAAEQYLSLCKATDDAFRQLVEYFDHQDHPVIILMFGDHQPFIEDEFYEEIMGRKISDLSDDENQKRYITRFILHANYDIPSGWAQQISVNYLSTLLSENAGIQLTEYNHFLESLYQETPVITALGCRNRQGKWFRYNGHDDTQSRLLVYDQAAFNNLRDHGHMARSIFYIKKKET